MQIPGMNSDKIGNFQKYNEARDISDGMDSIQLSLVDEIYKISLSNKMKNSFVRFSSVL